MGTSTSGHIHRCNILLNTFDPMRIYACKVLKQKLSGGSVPKDLNAKVILEATSLGHVTHAGIIRAVAIVKGNNPMIIFSFWNGNHLDKWMVYLGHDGKRPSLVGHRDFDNTMSAKETHIYDLLLDILHALI